MTPTCTPRTVMLKIRLRGGLPLAGLSDAERERAASPSRTAC